MLVTAEVSHVEISPYIAVAVVESLNHEATAVPMLLVVMVVVSLRKLVSLVDEEGDRSYQFKYLIRLIKLKSSDLVHGSKRIPC